MSRAKLRPRPDEEARFKENIDFILSTTNIPEAWLSQLLGYRNQSGLTMVQSGKTGVSKIRLERSIRLAAGLRRHLTEKRAAS